VYLRKVAHFYNKPLSRVALVANQSQCLPFGSPQRPHFNARGNVAGPAIRRRLVRISADGETSTMTTMLCRASNLGWRLASQSRTRSVLHSKRYLQVDSSVHAQAFLEPLETHPGITCLSLNRPKSKNAISMTLLQVFPTIVRVEAGLTNL